MDEILNNKYIIIIEIHDVFSSFKSSFKLNTELYPTKLKKNPIDVIIANAKDSSICVD